MAFDPVAHFQKFDFQSCQRLIVAVSGGSDSVALLCSVYDYLKFLSAGPQIYAVTVDHVLREGSAVEAAGVAALCATLNVPHIIKKWDGTKPRTGIQAAARQERRALLCEVAGELRADAIFTGHTLDDQVETIVMRQRRGSGPGLAGIAKASLAYNDRGDGSGIWIVRPLLAISRVDLRAYLYERQIPWVDDPSNNNAAFERIAVRNELESFGIEAKSALYQASIEAASKRQRLAKAAGVLVQNYVQEIVPGLTFIDPLAFVGAEPQALAVMLRALIAFAGGASSLGDGQVTAAIINRVAGHGFTKSAKPWRETSNGALIEIRQSGVYILREGRKNQQARQVFDGRYRPTRFVRSQGPHEAAAHENPVVPASLMRRANVLEPHYSVGNAESLTVLEAVHSGYPVRRLLNPWPDLVPFFDLELAEKMSMMAGCGRFPVYSYDAASF
jgi:tRNA(Ile)-lysidine synthase